MRSVQQSEIVCWLYSAAGHLSALIEMTEAKQPCAQAFNELKAVQAALHAAGHKITEC